MRSYDAIIIGAGPSGGQCARELAKKGKKILLAERSKDFSINNYSSAGAPNELIEAFELPDSVVGTRWNTIRMHSSHDEAAWKSPTMRGVIMDFKRLRAFLAKEATRHGGELRLGFSYQKHEQEKNGVRVWFKDLQTQESIPVQGSILIDATGGERQVLGKNQSQPSFPATGIEYLVEVPDQIYHRWANALSVFMGHRWMPQGYSWIFPMEPNTLKVGVGRYFQNETVVPHHKSYQHYLDIMMEECLGSRDLPILDKHGKTIIYTYKQKDLHCKGSILAIGDAVSSINPLALEGIRHAMISARIGAKHALGYLNGSLSSLKGYEPELRRYYGPKWRLCEMLMKIIYRQAKDRRVDDMVRAFRSFSFEEMIDLAFHYKLKPALKFLIRYAAEKARFPRKREPLSLRD